MDGSAAAGHTQRVLDRMTGWMYERLGSRYWLVLVAGEAGVSVFVALVTIAIISSYYDPTVLEIAGLAAAGCGLTLVAVIWAALRARPAFDTIISWRRTEAPSAAGTVAAWEAATTLTLRQYRRGSPSCRRPCSRCTSWTWSGPGSLSWSWPA